MISLPILSTIAILFMWVALTFSLALTEISFILALIFFIAGVALKKISIRDVVRKRLLVCLGILAVIIALSIIWSEHRYESFRGLLKVVEQWSVFFMAAVLFAQKKHFGWLRLVFLGTLLLSLTDSIYQYFVGTDFLRGFFLHRFKCGKSPHRWIWQLRKTRILSDFYDPHFGGAAI